MGEGHLYNIKLQRALCAARREVRALKVDNPGAVEAALKQCTTIREVLRVQHRACRVHRKSTLKYNCQKPCKLPIDFLRTTGVTEQELKLCQKLYPGVRLARLDRRTRAVRSRLLRARPVGAEGGLAVECRQCASQDVCFDTVTSDVVCRSCGWCARSLGPSWCTPCDDKPRTARVDADLERVADLFHHVCDRYGLGAMCRHVASDMYKHCRLSLQHLEGPEYVECACLVLAMRSRPSRHKLWHAK